MLYLITKIFGQGGTWGGDVWVLDHERFTGEVESLAGEVEELSRRLPSVKRLIVCGQAMRTKLENLPERVREEMSRSRYEIVDIHALGSFENECVRLEIGERDVEITCGSEYSYQILMSSLNTHPDKFLVMMAPSDHALAIDPCLVSTMAGDMFKYSEVRDSLGGSLDSLCFSPHVGRLVPTSSLPESVLGELERNDVAFSRVTTDCGRECCLEYEVYEDYCFLRTEDHVSRFLEPEFIRHLAKLADRQGG